jgi:hypothetical protein
MPQSTHVTSEARTAGKMMPRTSSTPQSTSERDMSINLMPINGAISPPTP